MANKYWVDGTGTWSATNTANWSTSSGGVGGAAVPTTADVAIFDTLSNATSYTVTRTATTAVLGINMAGPLTGTLTFAGSSAINTTTSGLTIASTGVSWTNTGTLTFSGTQTVTTNGVTLASPITIATAAITITLGSALTTTGLFNYTNGNINLNNFDFTMLSWSGISTSTRVITPGTGQFYITGNNATVYIADFSNVSFSGTRPTINFTYSGSTGTRTLSAGNPTAANAPNLIISAGSDTVSYNAAANNLNTTGFTGVFTSAGASNHYGNFTFGSGATTTSNANIITFAATSGTQTLTTNAVAVNFPFTQNGSGGTVALGSYLTMSSARTYTLTSGTFNLSGFNLTCGLFTAATATLSASGSTITLSGTGTVFTAVAGTTVTGAPNIAFSDTSVTGKTFAGGGKTYGGMQLGGTTGVATYTFTGANTWTGTWSSTKTTASTITLPASTTTTVGGWTISGSASNLITLNSSTVSTQATLTLTGGGTVSVNYLNIRDSSATPSTLTWYAGANSVNTSNNTGWIFTAPSANNSNFFFMFN